MITSPYQKTQFTPPAEHPRLMLRKKDLPRIRANMELPESRLAMEKWQYLCGLDHREYAETLAAGEYNMLYYLSIEAKALKALLEEDHPVAKELIAIVVDAAKGFHDRNKSFFVTRYLGHLLFVGSLLYDWHYEDWTPAQRETFIHECETKCAAYLEMKYPPAAHSAIVGHACEAQLLRDLLSFSIAIYDERPDVYEFCAGRIFDEYVPTFKEVYAGRFQNQGPTYGGYRWIFGVWAELLFRTMGMEALFDEAFTKTAESFVYLLRPDGEYFRLGDDFADLKGGYTKHSPATVIMFFAAALTGDPLYHNLYLAHQEEEYLLPSKHSVDYYEDGSYGEGSFSANTFLIWNRFTEQKPAVPRPKAQYFPSPVGITIYKDEAKETAVLMKIGEYWGANHDHFDTGCFQIYHKGILASDSGVYGLYGVPHAANYCNRTIAHNCITVFDPAKQGKTVTLFKKDALYDGGTRMPNNGRSTKHLKLWKEEYRMAKVLSHTEEENRATITGDLTEAYRETCEKVTRRMVFDAKEGPCGAFTVEDHILTQSEEFITQFHLHTQSEPQIEGNTITVSHGKGRLVCTVLKPSNAILEKIGGKGKECWVDGQNFPHQVEQIDGLELADYWSKTNDNPTEIGWGRITITPKEKSKEHRFLVKMELRDQ